MSFHWTDQTGSQQGNSPLNQEIEQYINARQHDITPESFRDGSIVQDAMPSPEDLFPGSHITQVVALFFCAHNVRTIQNTMRYRVFELTKVVIAPQSHRSLATFMKQVVYEHPARHQLNRASLKKQIAEWNTRTVNKCLEVLLPAIDARNQYKQTFGAERHIMPHPVDVSSTGTRIQNSGFL